MIVRSFAPQLGEKILPMESECAADLHPQMICAMEHFIHLVVAHTPRCVAESLVTKLVILMLFTALIASIQPMLKESASLTAHLHADTYGRWLQTCQKLVTLHVRVIVAVQIFHLPSLETTTTASQGIVTLLALTTSCTLTTPCGMDNSAVRKVPVAVMEETLHGSVWTLIVQPLTALKFAFVPTSTKVKTLQSSNLNCTFSDIIMIVYLNSDVKDRVVV